MAGVVTPARGEKVATGCIGFLLLVVGTLGVVTLHRAFALQPWMFKGAVADYSARFEVGIGCRFLAHQMNRAVQKNGRKT